MKKENNMHGLVFEFNVDDMNPQQIPYLLERLMKEGASDAFVIPIIMKKGRPGFLFKVTCKESIEENILEVIFCESTTIGVRKTQTDGVRLDRRSYKVYSSFGEITVKEIILPSGKRRIVPEYEECKKIAEIKKIPLREVQEYLLQELNQTEKLLPISNN